MEQTQETQTGDTNDTKRDAKSTQTDAETKTQTTEELEPTPEEKKVIAFEDHKRVLDDMHKYKVRATELEQKFKNQETQRLRETEDWKTLFEREKQEKEELASQYEREREESMKEKKFSRLKEIALKSGIDSRALGDLELLPFSEVITEKDATGRIKVLGAEAAIETLRQTRPHWFTKKTTQVNSKIPDINNNGNSVVSEAELIKLSLQAERTGDYTTYKQKMDEYIKNKGV